MFQVAKAVEIMSPSYFIVDSNTGEEIPAIVRPATENDFRQTELDFWQTSWLSTYIQRPETEEYALEIPETGELVGLGSYQDVPGGLIVFVSYLESEPESNPTMTKHKRYEGIGAALLAFGIQLSIDCGYGGAIYLKAKTTSLREHYIRDFGAVPFSHREPDMLLIEGDAASELFSQYLAEEDIHEEQTLS